MTRSLPVALLSALLFLQCAVAQQTVQSTTIVQLYSPVLPSLEAYILNVQNGTTTAKLSCPSNSTAAGCADYLGNTYTFGPSIFRVQASFDGQYTLTSDCSTAPNTAVCKCFESADSLKVSHSETVTDYTTSYTTTYCGSDVVLSTVPIVSGADKLQAISTSAVSITTSVVAITTSSLSPGQTVSTSSTSPSPTQSVSGSSPTSIVSYFGELTLLCAMIFTLMVILSSISDRSIAGTAESSCSVPFRHHLTSSTTIARISTPTFVFHSTGMDDNANSADDRSKVRRSAQACQRCRTLKARCLPSSEEGTCQRCFRSGYECAWGERRLRQRKQGSSRIVQVEKKIDRLFARIAGDDDDDSTAQNQAPSNRKTLWKGSVLSPPDTVDQHVETYEDDNESNHSLDEVSKLHEFDLSAEDGKVSAQLKKPAKDDPLSKTLAAYPEAEGLLTQYRSMSVSFPFVPIDDESTFNSVCTEKPMLLLAIVAVSSWRNKKLQMHLEKQFRTELANRTLIQPRKDLALLQSILVYVAWYTPSSSFTLEARLINFSGHTDEGEMRRAVLGCYYLCASVRAEFSVSTLLECRDYMHEWSRHLSENGEYDTDSVIELLIESRRISDMVHAQTYRNLTLPTTSGDQLLETFHFWISQCEGWKHQRGRREQARLLDLIRYSLETKLHKTLTSNLANDARQINNADRMYRQLSGLSSQLEAGKMFFDTLVAVSTDTTHLVSFAEWTTVPRMVMDMARLSMFSPSHPPEWNVKEAQDRIRLNLYLDSLCFRMHNLTTYNPPEQPHPDYWTVMKEIMQAVNAWYVRKMKSGTGNRITHSSAQFQAETEGGSGTAGLETDSSHSVGYEAPTPNLFDDSSFNFMGYSNEHENSHCMWLPMDLQMSIDAMNGDDLEW
ncbi:hypothetical protein M409DRAFT_52652 [Zasmidium cellare ATCC 36951]|uniref:Zn(2)-C6 fungal-type domain-containing protein n=1 Tax=Zasmidium cellare ATCC 36951 TaxID=1080233 RepID=A0A6A6CQH1_ZASCE|nr:uncharacterized protein M409DRAFT_52652 [Zasmidium cellare ATCC 36951]KAF2169404.1 hypothetical protein M409DRAFT_52652 [Zasmidium cellare ATCC 36951]